MMPDSLKQRLEWARFVISSDAEPDNIGTAAHVVLVELERLEIENTGLRSEFGRVALAFKRGESRHQTCLDIASGILTPNAKLCGGA